MTARAFRFIHAADLHLEQPLSGLTQVSDSIRDRLIDAPVLAAERIFDAAIENKVDFVVLAGGVVSPLEASTHALSRLVRKFQRLEKQNIAVYWIGGTGAGADHWPKDAMLPANVHLFGSRSGDRITHHRGKEVVATLIGFMGVEPAKIRGKDIKIRADEGFTIGVARGRATAASLAKTKLNYWALGGRSAHETICDSPPSHDSGASQGRSPAESGAHGCTLVEVDTDGEIHSKQISTDVVRWHTEHITLPADAPVEDLKERLTERALILAENADQRTTLVSWQVTGLTKTGPSGYRELAAELVAWLRKELASSATDLWTVALAFNPPNKLPEAWRDEETILGEFLRSIRHCMENPDEPLGLDEYLSDELADSLANTVRLDDPTAREEVLREATLMGVDLLQGNDPA